MKNIFYRILFVILFSFFICILGVYIFKPVFLSKDIIIPFSLNNFNISTNNPLLWKKLKLIYIIFYIFSSIICTNFIFSFFNKFRKKDITNNYKFSDNTAKATNSISLYVGDNENHNLVFIPEKSLYQNILITGTIR